MSLVGCLFCIEIAKNWSWMGSRAQNHTIVVEETYIFIVLKVEIGHSLGLLIVHLPTFPTKSTNNSLFYQTFWFEFSTLLSSMKVHWEQGDVYSFNLQFLIEIAAEVWSMYYAFSILISGMAMWNVRDVLI